MCFDVIDFVITIYFLFLSLIVVANTYYSVGFLQTDEELAKEGDGARHALLKDADKYSKAILGRLSRGHGCMKGIVFVSVALTAGAAIMSQNIQSWDVKKLSEVFGFP